MGLGLQTPLLNHCNAWWRMWSEHTITVINLPNQKQRLRLRRSFPGGASGKEPICQETWDLSSVPGSGRSPEGGNGNPLQYSCLRIPWTEEPGGLQSLGLQRVRHDWYDLACTQAKKSMAGKKMIHKIRHQSFIILVVAVAIGVVFVSQLCPTLCDPMDYSLPGFSVHGILQASILEWVAIPFSRGSSRPRGQTQVSPSTGRFFTIQAPREVHFMILGL